MNDVDVLVILAAVFFAGVVWLAVKQVDPIPDEDFVEPQWTTPTTPTYVHAWIPIGDPIMPGDNVHVKQRADGVTDFTTTHHKDTLWHR